jgi:TnpA family transposase
MRNLSCHSNGGLGQSAAADGTHFETYEDNLLAEHHIRYGKTGGIAYRHVADNYIALFSRFIACGTYEACRKIRA